MAITIVKVKRNDVGRAFTDTLTTDGTAANLAGATVKFLLRGPDGTLKVNATATVVSVVDGTVSYTTVAGDLNTQGEHSQEWEATFAGGEIGTWPDEGHNRVIVVEDLNPA